MHRLKKLKIYERALILTKEVRAVAKSFPRDELFELTSQFKRAIDSVALNIAEGAGNKSNKEFARFLSYAMRSGFECLGCLDIALVNGYVSHSVHTSTVASINEVLAMIYRFQDSLSEVPTNQNHKS